jgi:putative ABC transport system permease protein
MASIRRLFLRIWSFLRRSAAEDELARELASHLSLLEEDFQRRGMRPEEARQAARRAIGGVEQAKELHREVRSFIWLEDVRRDVRHGVRTLAKNPGFASAAVVTLTLGIGAVTAIFSVVDATLLRPLPYSDADRLVALRSVSVSGGRPDQGRTARGNLADWQAQAQSFEAIAGYRWRTVDLTEGERSERLRGLYVTPEFFEVFGARPQLGRGFVAADRGTATIVLGRDVWELRFRSDSALIGRSLEVNSQNFRRVGRTPHVVVGVVTTHVRFPPITSDFQLGVSNLDETIDLWTPEFVTSNDSREGWEFDVVGKLKPGITIEAAQAEMDAIATRLAESYPASNRDWGIRIVPLRDQALGGVRRVVLLLFLSGGIVLLIACGNVASLFLVRGMARQREVTIRMALGAGRLRIARQFLVESVLIALAAAILSIIVTLWGIMLLQPLLASLELPLLPATAVNTRVLAFAFVCALATACITGTTPAFRVSRVDGILMHGLEGRGLSPGRTRRRMVGALVSSEVALTLVLLIGTGLLVKSAARLLQVDPGFNPESLLTMTISLPNNKFEWKHNVVFSRQVIDAVASLGPVRAAAVVQGVPMRPGSFWGRFDVEGRQLSDALPIARLRVVSPGYFNVMQIPIRSGRDLDVRDEVGDIGELRTVIVNQALANHYWPGEDAVGKRIRGDSGNAQPWATIIGVVGDVRYASLDSEPDYDLCYPEALFPQAAITLLVRTRGDPLDLAADIRSRINQVDPEAVVTDIRPMEALIADSLASRRLSTMLVIAFAGMALLLALTGIYSVIVQSIAQRKLEIGIRMALGAQHSNILALVLRQGLLLSAVGMTVGLVGAASLTRYLEGLLFGVTPLDRTTFFAVSLLFAFVAMLASYVPARRAMRLDPLTALRWE